jgi:transcriptional regulator with XRE-family HTH domain
MLAFGLAGRQDSASGSSANEVGARLREIREARGLSKNALGQASSTTGQTVRNIEGGQTFPTVATVELLAKALAVSPCRLAFGGD